MAKSLRWQLLASGTLLFLATGASGALAQATPPRAADASQETVIITGTRVTGMTAADSSAPITVLGADSLSQGVGSSNLMQALGQTIPSLNLEVNGGDLAAAVLSAALRGLSPNDTLVMVDGKRRHSSAVFQNNGTGSFAGSSAPDLSLIPKASIDHIEVLLDGAAAQYGTDAVAGVVNIILKKRSTGGMAQVTAGQFYNGEGETYDLTSNIGMPLFDRGFVNLTVEKQYHGYTVRGGADARLINALGQTVPEGTIGNTPNAAGIIPCSGGVCIPLATREAMAHYPRVNQQGDAEYNTTMGMYNAGYDIGENIHLYSTGSLAHRYIRIEEIIRLPTQIIAAPGSSQPCSASNHQGYNTALAADGITPACAIGVSTATGRFVGEASSVATHALPGVTTLGNNGLNAQGLVVSSGQAGTLYTPGELAMYPEGFNPLETMTEDDYQYSGGVKFGFAGWDVDIAGSYGKDIAKLNVVNSGNRSLFIDTHTSPTTFDTGSFAATEFVGTIDATHQYNVGLASPLTVALGVEAREDTYALNAGDAASHYKEGSQSFPGFVPSNAGNHSRKNYAAYIDLAVAPIPELQLDIAGRAEHYSDFGDAQIGKITARYDFSPQFAVRGTISTGFRAPTLEEEFYTATVVTPTFATVQLQADSNAAKILGLQDLKPEISTSFSLGIVAHPFPDMDITVDAYSLALGNRIARSGTVNSVGGAINTPLVNTAIIAAGNSLDPTAAQNGVSAFLNGFSTTSQGVDLTVNYPTDFGELGLVNWTLVGNYNETTLQFVNPVPGLLLASNPNASFFQPYVLFNFVHDAPNEKLSLAANWSLDDWGLTARETYYGPVHQFNTPNGGPPLFVQNQAGVGIFDLEGRFNISDGLQFALGGNNIFNVRPDTLKFATTTPNATTGAAQLVSGGTTEFQPIASVFNPNGGYYYGRLTYTF